MHNKFGGIFSLAHCIHYCFWRNVMIFMACSLCVGCSFHSVFSANLCISDDLLTLYSRGHRCFLLLLPDLESTTYKWQNILDVDLSAMLLGRAFCSKVLSDRFAVAEKKYFHKRSKVLSLHFKRWKTKDKSRTLSTLANGSVKIFPSSRKNSMNE